MTDAADTRPRVVIPLKQIEQLAMAIDFAYAQALDPDTRLPMELPPARLAVVFPRYQEATPQMASMMTAVMTIEWLSGHKVIVQQPAEPMKKAPRPAKPPPQLHKCGHCGLAGLKGPQGRKCIWCGETAKEE